MFDGSKLVGDLAQGGAFAVLVAISVWLMYWVPIWVERYAKTRDLETEARIAVAKENREAVKDVANINGAALDRVTATYTSIQDRTIKAFQDESKTERDICERRHKELIEAMRELSEANEERHQQTRHNLANLVQAADFDRRIVEGLRLLRGAGHEPETAREPIKPMK